MILASGSPRRREILKKLGLEIEVVKLSVEEKSNEIEPKFYLMEVSLKKAREVANLYPNEYVLSGDTGVVVDSIVLGKPKDEMDTIKMLKRLSGRSHSVITAYTIKNISKDIEITSYEETKVTFKNLTDEDIKWYINTGEPFDKAGGYGIQGKGTLLIRKIEGDFFNVMGLPISKIVDDFKKLGISKEELKKI